MLIATLRQSKSVAVLLGSNLTATLTIATGTFLVARIVTPAEFGKYALAAQFALSIYPVLTLRYEHALPLLGNRPVASLHLLGCFLLLFIATLLFLVIGWIGLSISALSVWLPRTIIDLFPLVGLAALTLALGSIFQSVALTRGAIWQLAIARVFRAVALVSMQVGLALSLGASAPWLLIGEVSANLVHGAILATALGLGGVLAAARRPWSQCMRRIVVLGVRYKEFPLITLPHIIVHSVLGLLFATTLGAVYGATALGQYYLMRKLVFGVLGLFNVAIHQHAIAEASRLPRAKLFEIALQALVLMGSVGVASAAAILLVGPELFVLAVGDKWTQAGSMAIASASLILLEPVTSTLAFLPIFLGLQHIAFAIAVLQGSIGIAAIGIAGWLGLDAISAIMGSSLAMSAVMLCYVFWLLMRAHKAKGGQEE